MNRLLLATIPLALTACAAPPTGPGAGMPATATATAPTLSHSSVLTKLESPWDMAFLPDGTMFFTEKCHGLSVRQPNGSVIKLLGMKDAKGYASQRQRSVLRRPGRHGRRGGRSQLRQQPLHLRLLDVEPDRARHQPRDATQGQRRTPPASPTAPTSSPTSRTSRAPVTIPSAARVRTTAGGSASAPATAILYVTTGDTHNGVVPQSPTLIGGKVLRIDRDGKAAPGNGAPAGFDPRIYTYGHRNPQGITFRPGTNQPFTAENGPWHSDEVTALVPGGNAGWDPRPNVGGREACPDNYCGYSPNQMGAMDPKQRAAFMPMTDTKTYPNAMKPAWNNDGLSQGMFGATFLSGPQWKGWNGKMIVGLTGIGIHGTPVGNRLDVLDIARRWTVGHPQHGQSADAGCTVPLGGAGAGRQPVCRHR